MQNPRLAARYAKSLLDLTIERDTLEITLADMQLLDRICNQNPDFVNMLRSPIISNEKKVTILNAILTGHIHELTHGFIHLLVTKGRELNLPEIVTAFIEQYNTIKNIITIKLTTATAMEAGLKDAIIAKVTDYMPGKTIDLKTDIKEELIGGFVVAVGDKLYDASIRKSLKDIRSEIVDLSYVSKM